MTVKIFYFGRDAVQICEGKNYIGGGQLDCRIDPILSLIINSWDGIAAATQIVIVNALAAKGWTEGEERD